MESLSYGIARLLRGSLPWRGRGRDCVAIKSAWIGPLLCAGYPSVFGEFVDYTRGLSFSAKPDYATWRQKFRDLVPGLPEHPLYDSTDEQGPHVGIPRSDSRPETFDSSLFKPKTLDSMSCFDSDDDFSSTSSWPDASGITQADLFGDEGSTVRERLASINEPPTMDQSSLKSELVEVMVP